MKYIVKTKDSVEHTYGIWNNEMCAFQFVGEWNGTETVKLEEANFVAERFNFNSLVETWKKAYMITCPTLKQKKQRLKELQTWDNPRAGNELEHRAKKHALIRLTAAREEEEEYEDFSSGIEEGFLDQFGDS